MLRIRCAALSVVNVERYEIAVKNRFSLPNLGVGVGLRTTHYNHILTNRPAVDWFEIISENYMQTEGRPLHVLDQVAEQYPIVMHGVSMSIGSTAPLDWAYLRELRTLRDRVKARWLSDHLCFTGINGRNTHDLLPMPLTEESLALVVSRVQQVQDFMQAPLLLENPSTYAAFAASTISEPAFLSALCEQADCALLLDVNNVYVSAFNHGFDATAYIDALPAGRVVQFHVAGHTHNGTHIVDTHIGPVVDPVWRLYEHACRRFSAATLLEWDAEIPAFDVVHAEAAKARAFAADAPPGVLA